MNRAVAIDLLSLAKCQTALTEDIVQTAYRTKVKAVHPDSGAFEGNAGAIIPRLKAARDYLLKNLRPDDDFACRQCSGVGMVRTGKLGWRECTACHGSGERR